MLTRAPAVLAPPLRPVPPPLPLAPAARASGGCLQVVEMEGEKGEWGFKAHKQIVKALFRERHTRELLEAYFGVPHNQRGQCDAPRLSVGRAP